MHIHLPPGAATSLIGALLLAAVTTKPVQAQSVEVVRTPNGWSITHHQGQGSRSIVNVPSVPILLARMERVAPEDPRRAEMLMSTVLAESEHLPSAVVDSIFDGLQHLAATSRSAEVRSTSVRLLTIAGARDEATGSRVARRLVSLYHQTSDTNIRQTLVAYSFPALAEATPALGLMREIATQNRAREDFPNAPEWAISGLSLMDEGGRAVLRNLYERGLVTEPKARANLTALARNGFRQPKRGP